METKEKIRKHYKKPQVNKVKLEIEEAVLAGCKGFAGDSSGKIPQDCSNPGCKTTYGS